MMKDVFSQMFKRKLTPLISLKSNNKFLFFVDHLRGGGAEIVTIRLIKNLIEMNNEVGVVVLSMRDSKLEIPDKVSVFDLSDLYEWNKLSFNSGELPNDVKLQIKTIVEGFSADIIILNWWLPHIFSDFINGEKVWHWLHGRIFTAAELASSEGPIRVLKNAIYYIKRFYKIFSKKRIIFLHSGFANMFPFVFYAFDYVVIPNGVCYSNNEKFLDKKYDVAYVGRLSDEKQPEHSLIAFSKSELKGRMVVVGDGNLLDGLIKTAQYLNIADRVDFVGWVDYPDFFLKQSRALILSSKTEGLPLVLLESLALGVPVVSYNSSPAIVEVFSRLNALDFMVKQGDCNELSKALSRAVNVPYSISSSFWEIYNLDRMAKDFIGLVGLK